MAAVYAKKRHAKAWKEEKKMKYTVAIGRFFYSLLFIMRGMTHFSKTSDWVRSKPGSSLCFHRSSVLGFNGRGRRFDHPFRISREGGRLGVGSVPGSGHCDVAPILKGHGSIMQQMQMSMFLKNIALMGAALAFSYFGAGPVSVDARKVSQPVA
jgi:uncharacterized membrane protein YphA (DoxX/SURF4 family)